jgi:hypothetical protein
MSSPNDLLDLVDDCEHREQRLTDWEREFIDTIRNRIEANRGVTPAQEDKLLEIWDRVTTR